MQKIKDFLRNRPALNIRALEQEVGMPQNTLSNLMSDKVNKAFPDKWIWPLCETLCRYGLELNGQRFTYDPNVHCFFVETVIPDREPETVEVPGVFGGIHFEYLVPMYRDVINDDFELKNYLQ